jgi:hypothetical protein
MTDEYEPQEEEQREVATPPRTPRRPPPEPIDVGAQVGEAWNKLKKRDLKQTAIMALAIGILFHACVFYVVLGSGGSGSKPSTSSPGVTAPKITATPTPALNRQDCIQIRGTDYKSEEERLWFQATFRSPYDVPCLLGVDPSGG